MTKFHRQGGLNNRNLFSHSLGGQKSQIKVPVNCVSPETSLFGLQMATFSLCPHVSFSPCVSLVSLPLVKNIVH